MKEILIILFIFFLVKHTGAMTPREYEQAIVREVQARIKHINTYNPHKDKYPDDPIKLVEVHPETKKLDKALMFKESQRDQFKVRFHRGKIYDHRGYEYDTQYLPGGAAHFVVTKNKEFLLMPKRRLNYLHPHGMVNGEEVICAGTMVIYNGYLKEISDISKEYEILDYYHLTKTITFLKRKGIKFRNVKVIYNSDSKHKMEHFNVQLK